MGADGVSVWLDPVYGHNVAMPHSEGPDRRCGCQSLFGRARDRRCDGPAVASGVLGRRERLCQYTNRVPRKCFLLQPVFRSVAMRLTSRLKGFEIAIFEFKMAKTSESNVSSDHGIACCGAPPPFDRLITRNARQ